MKRVCIYFKINKMSHSDAKKTDVEMKDDTAKKVEEEKKEEVYDPFFGMYSVSKRCRI
jgi:hypothetical protein